MNDADFSDNRQFFKMLLEGSVKKSLLLLSVLFIAFGITIQSQASSRLDSLSLDVRQVDDIDLIWLYPNQIMQYKNTADFRLNNVGSIGFGNTSGFGNGVNEWGGVIAEESALGGVVGVYVNRPYLVRTPAYYVTNYFQNANDPIEGLYSNPGNDHYLGQPVINNTIDLFWAQSVGGADFGIHFNYGDNGIQAVGNWEVEQYFLSLGLGLGTVGPFSQLDLHADYGTNFTTQIGLAAKNHDNGTNSVKLGGLGRLDVNDTNYFKVFADTSMNQDNLTDLNGYNFSDTTLLVGGSWDQKVSEGKGLIATGLVGEYVGASVKNSYNEDGWVLLWNGAIEHEVADWLTLRAGLEGIMTSRDYSSNAAPTYTQNNYQTGYQFSVGYAVNVENWVWDGEAAASSLEQSINNAAPGNGLLFGNGNLLTITEMNLRYRF